MTKKETEHCFYCDGVATSGVGDHFPLPARNGGLLTVPCCTSCHQMKDTIPLDKWSVLWLSPILQDFPKMSRETRLFLGKALAVFSDVVLEGPLRVAHRPNQVA